jgi:signal transduction histidine kinase
MALRIPFLQKHFVLTAALAVALALFLCGASLWSITLQLGKPFPGFFYLPDYIFGGTNLQDYSGWQAGLRPWDRILAADGLPPSEIHAAVLRAGVGHAVTYTVQRGTQTLEFSVPVMEFTTDVLWRYLPGSILFALVSMTVGVFVYLRNPSGLLHRYLLVYLLGWSCINIIDWESYLSYIKWTSYIYQSGIAVIAVTGWIFFWSFPADEERRAFLKRVPLVPAFAALGVAAAVYYPVMFTLASQLNRPNLWQVYTFSASWGTFILFTLGSMVLKPLPLLQVALRTNSAPLIRQQATVLLVGIAVGLGGFTLYFWLPGTMHTTPPGSPQWGHVFATLYPLSIGYAILRYRLFDIRVVVRKGLVYSLLTLILTAFFLVLFEASGKLFEQLTGHQSVFSALIPALFVAILFQPVRDRIQVQVDRAFFRRAYELRRSIAAFTRELNSLRGPGEVTPLVFRTVRETLGVQDVALWLLDSGGRYAAYPGRPEPAIMAASSPLVEMLKKERAPLPSDHEDAGLRQALAGLGASVAVPLLLGDTLTGFLALGEKRSGEPYSLDDLDLLVALSQSAALALENSRLYEERIQTLHQHLAQVTAAQEEERRRIARELHDGVGPAMASMNLRLRTAHKLLGPENPRVAEEIDELTDLVQGNIRDIRRLIYDLHPAVLEELGLAAALREYVERYTRETGRPVNLLVPESGPRLPHSVEIVLFRAIQEALMNIYRHAGPTRQVGVTLRWDRQQVWACIEDDGQGFSVEDALKEARQGGHLGLWSMRERVEAEGGQLQLESCPGAGTSIKISLPLPAASRSA